MSEIKSLTAEAIGNAVLVSWDYVDIASSKQYDIYRIPECYHSIGGEYGENDYYVCDRDITPSIDNLIAYSGPRGGVQWGITVNQQAYNKNKWNNSSIQYTWVGIITRNGTEIYSQRSYDMNYLLSKLQTKLSEIQEFGLPVSIFERDWEQKIVGSKVWYNDEPGIVKRVAHNLTVFIEPDGIGCFKCPQSWIRDNMLNMWDEDYADGLSVEFDSENLQWYRTDSDLMPIFRSDIPDTREEFDKIYKVGTV